MFGEQTFALVKNGLNALPLGQTGLTAVGFPMNEIWVTHVQIE